MEAFNILMVFFTGMLALLTAFLARYTKQLVKEQQYARQPEVVASLEDDSDVPNVTNMVIENIGNGLARDINVQVVKDINVVASVGQEYPISSISFLKQDFIKPHKKLQKRLGTLKHFDGEVAQFHVSYQDAYGKKYHSTYVCDLKSMGHLAAHNPPITEISESLKKISQDIGHVATGFKRIKVETYDAKDREEEHPEWKQMAEERKNVKRKRLHNHAHT